MALRDSLSNPRKPLLRLAEALAGRQGEADEDAVGLAIEGERIARDVVEHRILSPDEAIELAAAYQLGVSQNELARRFGVHRHTVDRHLAKANVAKRPPIKMGPEVLAEAVSLYAQGLSVAAVGKKLGLSASTVYSTFVREQVKMRAAKKPRQTSITGATTNSPSLNPNEDAGSLGPHRQ